MRKLVLQMQISLDGFNSTGPNDEQNWVTGDLDSIKQHVIDISDASDTIILGRKLAEGYIPFWEETVQDVNHPMYEFAIRIVKAKKVVFTTTLENSIWDGVEIAKGNLADEISRLKQQDGKNIMVYGGSAFVSSLISEGLVDEFYFFINPIALGKGVSAFASLKDWQQLELRNVMPCNNGVVILHYIKK